MIINTNFKKLFERNQSNLYYINYDYIEKYYNDFKFYQSFSKYIIEDKNNKLENMYKKLMISIIILFQFLMRL